MSDLKIWPELTFEIKIKQNSIVYLVNLTDYLLNIYYFKSTNKKDTCSKQND